MKTLLTMLMGAGLIAAIAGCGGGGSGSYNDTTTQPTPSLVLKISYYPDGLTLESGLVQTGTQIQEGEWWHYFDAPSSTLANGVAQKPQWRRWFKQGTWIQDQPWREWNLDGSIRDDYTDALTTSP